VWLQGYPDNWQFTAFGGHLVAVDLFAGQAHGLS
jgi:hypothetical protein